MDEFQTENKKYDNGKITGFFLSQSAKVFYTACVLIFFAMCVIASFTRPDSVKVLSELIGTIIWPIVALIGLEKFKPEVGKIIDRMKEFDIFGVKAKLEDKLDQAVKEAEKAPERPPAATELQVERATEVKQIVGNNLALINTQVEQLSTEYESTRSSMRPGDSRTRRMEVVAAKMRAIGLAAYSLRHELSISASAGKRLQAIACLQVKPDYDMTDWLADRLASERPFVAYHALVALNIAANDPSAKYYAEYLRISLEIAKRNSENFGRDTDRISQLAEFQRTVLNLS